MEPTKLKTRCRISEVTTLGSFVVGAVNQTDFSN